MNRDLFREQYLAELEGMKKAKILLHRNQVLNRSEEAATTAMKIDLISNVSDLFEKFIAGQKEEISREELQRNFLEELDTYYKKIDDRNSEFLKIRDYKSSFKLTVAMEEIDELKNHLDRYLNLIEGVREDADI